MRKNRMRKYIVSVRVGCSLERREVEAKNAYEAWCKVAYTPVDGEYPYSAWVEEVIYKTGKVHKFNSSEGNPLGE